MQFTSYDLGYLPQGVVVEVTLSGDAANVKLLDSSDFANYRANRGHQYIGGHFRQSPARLLVPRAGHWHVAVDHGGSAGSTRSGVRVIQPVSAL
jgi:hypothetical protein